MGLDVLTNAKIDELIQLAKRVTNPNARNKIKGKHRETNYTVTDISGDVSFNLFLRQNMLIDDDFSCGLLWNMPSGETAVLVRYNGNSHPHLNALENQRLGYECHIHRVTERYVLAGKKPEGFAESTTRYWTLKGALNCLLTDCNVQGLLSEPDEPMLPL